MEENDNRDPTICTGDIYDIQDLEKVEALLREAMDLVACVHISQKAKGIPMYRDTLFRDLACALTMAYGKTVFIKTES